MTTPPDLAVDAAGEPSLPQFTRAKPPSLKAAFVVLGCAAVVSFGGFAVALIGGGKPPSQTVSGLAAPVPGVSLAAVNASGALMRIASAGMPPADILHALVVPNGARIVDSTSQDAGVDQYDRSMKFQVETTMAELVKFYRVELKRSSWSVLGTYQVRKDESEVLAQREGSDGYEWEVGVIVTPVNPSISPALAGDGQTSASMGLTLRLFEVPDGS